MHMFKSKQPADQQLLVLSEGLSNEDKCLMKGYEQIDLVLKPGLSSYDTITLPLSKRASTLFIVIYFYVFFLI